MKYARSLLFIPADKKKMLDKIDDLSPDVFILDLEDGVSTENKETARNNISTKLKSCDTKDKTMFIRLNGFDSNYIYEDIEKTIDEKIYGYMIPKFESVTKLKKLFDFISNKEKEKKIGSNKIKLILMIESSKGLVELYKLNSSLHDRVIAICFGAEDYLFSLSGSAEASAEMMDFARKIIITYAKANNLLAIDTVFRNYKDDQGLKNELAKIRSFGFNSKLALHPAQINIINSAFTPTADEIEKAKIILMHEKEIEEKGAISINGVMYDLPHLKWAKKIETYMEDI